MGHHLEAASAYSVYNFSTLLQISNLQLLLKEDGCLLVRGLDDARYEEGVRRGRRRVQKGEKVDRLNVDDLVLIDSGELMNMN